jgi:TrmH family RNA methyltransferase
MLIRITSSENSRIRLVRKLSTRRGRGDERRFVAEGRNLITEIIERELDVDFIMIPDSLMSKKNAGSSMIRGLIDSPDVVVCEIAQREFDRLTNAENGIDMLAVVRMMDADTGLLGGLSSDDNILILDCIQDPGNMGTLIRTAVAAGYKAIIAMSGTVDIYSPKVLRATAGMVFGIPVIYVRDADELRTLMRDLPHRMTVTVPDGGRLYYEEDLTKGIALVIGNEGNGVSDAVMEMADIKVTLPMKGNVESLNAAVAAAILMYESMRDHQEQ